MKRFCYALLVAGLCLSVQKGMAQDNDLNIFGYFQSSFTHSLPAEDSTLGKTNNTFAVQQLNLFLSKNISDDFSAFVNVELVNSFSSERNWGGLNLEEAWMKYYNSDAFSIKAGLLIPRFNNLNEIKNRTPILPYAQRPLVYEASIADLISLEDFVPQRAYLQVYGNMSVADGAMFDYAAYVGNSNRAYIASANGAGYTRGADSTLFKMVGGRVGMKIGDLKFGVSSTYDREKQMTAPLVIGNIPRIRIGGDLSYSIAGFSFEGEIIAVRYTLTDVQQGKIDALQNNPQTAVFGTSLDKNFYYGNLSYNITPQLYVYAGYGYMESMINAFWKNGFTSITGGAGYRVNEAIVLKAQYANYKLGDTPLFKYNQNSFYAAASVFF